MYHKGYRKIMNKKEPINKRKEEDGVNEDQVQIHIIYIYIKIYTHIFVNIYMHTHTVDVQSILIICGVFTKSLTNICNLKSIPTELSVFGKHMPKSKKFESPDVDVIS